ncbi:MAG: amino acid adenylation domain-containing protein [Nostoc sp.]|uniref:non-ribosomal peptide synthetase n=1 Tax=Nostoc sp. TaxID=1180 RepID=UPI002FF7F8B1
MLPTDKFHDEEGKKKLWNVVRSVLSSSRKGPPMGSVSRGEDLPLSFAQERLWFLAQFETGTTAYNMSAAFHLTGLLNVTALEQSLVEIVNRHEILRTIFPVVDGQPRQVIAEKVAWKLPIINLQEIPSQQREAEAQRYATQQTQQPFDLAQGPLWHFQLLRLAAYSHVLHLNVHHIIFDQWSQGLFLQELATLYEAFLNGEPSPLPQLPIQYVDFAHWQRQWLSGEVLANQLNYWKQHMAGIPPLLQIPSDRSRPLLQTFQGSTERFYLNSNLTSQIKTLSQQSGVTLFMTLLAAFATLMSRYSGQENVVLGSPIANRNRSEIKSLIGFFANTLALRIDLSENPSFRELLSRVQQVALDAYQHQDLPFEKLVQELQPQRNLNQNPLVQVMFSLQNLPKISWNIEDLSLSPFDFEIGSVRFDLEVYLWEVLDGIRGNCFYNTDMFDAATIKRMLGHFQTLLEGIVADPDQCISGLPLLTTSDCHQLLNNWNDTQADYPLEKFIYQIFEEQVELTPDAVAVIFENQLLSYQQLNHYANQLAHHLQKMDVRAEVLVGVCVERSLDLIVGLLGILKAGGAYVPLDPAYPKDRLALMLEDAAVPVLLTQKHLIDKLPSHQAKVVCIDTDWQIISTENSEDPQSEVKPTNLAYLIYTSGSTGKPKGVQITHRSVVNFLTAMQQQLKLTKQDSLLSVTSLSFDIAVLEIFLPLTLGAKVILISREVTANGLQLLQQLNNSAATVMQATPATWRMLLEAGWKGNAQLKILCGGEALPQNLAHQLCQRSGEVWNLYGPTETTVWSTIHRIDEQEALVTIGHPIANTQIYILDKYLQPVPVGVPAELYIGGAGLARGYFHQPKLTTEKFIHNPFSCDPESRLYKTGDLARYLSDGNIEYLGRLDNQVKIRGFRIELGEIEALLAQHPTIQQNVVTARADNPQNQRLVAYIVPHPEQTPTTDELRHFLKQKLPEYMVPSAFVFLDALPLTPNGKIDRRALPAADSTRLDSENTYLAPRDELELQMTKIWEEVLGIQPIGVRDNFFELGGHSILAVKLFWQIEKTFSKNLPLAILFQSGTVEALAKIISQEDTTTNKALVNTLDQSTSSWSSLVKIQPNGSKPPFFCIHGLGGEVLCFRELALHLGLDQPFYGLQPKELDGEKPFYTRVEDMATHYIQEIQTLQPNGAYFLGGYSFGGIVAFEMARQLQEQGQLVGILVLLDSCRPGYSWRASFLKRIFLHLNNVVQQGPKYIWQKALKWSYWRKQYFQNTYNRYLEDVLNLPLTDKHLKIIDANTEAVRKYIFSPYQGQVILLRPDDQSRDEAIGVEYDPQFGWGDLLLGGLDIHYIPGSHLDVLNEPHVQVLAETLRNCLIQAQSPKN